MSRIAKKYLAIPSNVRFNKEDRLVKFLGPKGEIKYQVNEMVLITVKDDLIFVSSKSDSVKGAKSIQSLYPKNTVTIFILPPNLDDLRKRLRRRGTDSEKRIKKRMDRLELELKEKDWFEYHVINNQIEHASNELIKIIEKQTEGVLYES